MSFLSKGEEVLNRVIAECDNLGKSEGTPKMEGRYMRIMLTPVAPGKPKKNHDGTSPDAKKPEEPKKEKSKPKTPAPEKPASEGVVLEDGEE